MTKKLIAIGQIHKPVGLKGLCAIEHFGSSLLQLKLPYGLSVGSSETATEVRVLSSLTARPKGYVGLFKDINDVEMAGTLRGKVLFLEQEQLPPLANDRFYHFELEGMRVRTDSNEAIGEIVSVENFPTVDTIHIKRSSGDVILVPLTADAVVEVDKLSGYMTLRKTFVDELLE